MIDEPVPHRRLRRVLILVAVAVPVLTVGGFAWYLSGYMPGTLHRDENGFFHGTGTQQYFYPSGRIKVEDHYVAGELHRITLYKPDGSVFATTDATNGIGYSLRDDGSLRCQMEFKNGIADGKAIYYREDGTVDYEKEFRNGHPVDTQPATGSPDS